MSSKKPVLFICILLTAATLIAFWQVKDADFLIYDDAKYVTENGPVLSGFTMDGIRWAFTTLYAEFWHPLTWLSHMLDVEVFGLSPRWHHLTNLWLHIANTLLLFLVFRRMTKALWQSAFVAGLFALHPLHVESVAWVAERKDVLSAFFWVLTLGAYAYYVERPGLRRYLAVLLFFVFGLMAKPMLVTLPFALLLLDFWPLQRFGPEKSGREIRTREVRPGAGNRRKGKAKKKPPVDSGGKTGTAFDPNSPWVSIGPLLWEKIPLFALTVLSAILAYSAQQARGGAGFLDGLPPGDRLANAFVSYVVYIGKMIWPANLAVFYPYPAERPLWQVGGAVFLFVGVLVAVIRAAKRMPYLAVGWLWYVGTLVPVIGIVQVGDHAMADRYTYISLTGLFIMGAWGAPELLRGWRYQKEALILSGTLILSCLFMATWMQVGYWRNSITLFEHTFKVTEPNSITYKNRGTAYSRAGNYRQAMEDLQKAIELNPTYSEAYNNRAGVYVSLGNYRQAVEDCDKAIEISPKYAMAYNNRASVQVSLGNYRQAIEDCDRAIELNPRYAEAYHNRGNAHARLGKYRRAIEDYDKALEMNPRYAPAYNSRAGVYQSGGNFKRAVEDLDRAIALNPNYAVAYNNRGNAYAGLGNNKQAIEDLNKAIEINPKYAEAYNNRAGVYGTLGNYRQAVQDCDQAIELNPKYAEAYNNRGNAYTRLGDYRKGIENYGQALEINPKYAGAYHNRAAAYLSLRNYRQAVEDLKTAARLGYEPAQKSLKSQGLSWQ
jgi:protein O-mannosyl-transferase